MKESSRKFFGRMAGCFVVMVLQGLAMVIINSLVSQCNSNRGSRWYFDRTKDTTTVAAVTSLPETDLINDSLWIDSVETLPPLVDMKTISYRTYDNKYIFFGMPGEYRLYLQPGEEMFPPVPGMFSNCTVVKSRQDSSICARFAIGLKCPDDRGLLNWMNAMVSEGLPFFFGKQDGSFTLMPFHSDREIAMYYLNVFKRSHVQGPDTNEYPEQYAHAAAGLLIVSCSQKDNLCTFYKAEWSEWTWYEESYYTVESRTGKELKLSDLVDKSNYERLGRLVILYLENSNGEQVAKTIDLGTGESVLKMHNCCALIDEGLILTFPKGTFASNAEGAFRAVIPYAELKGILKENNEDKVVQFCRQWTPEKQVPLNN